MDWSLQNIEDAHRASPNTFFIPDLEERRSQPAGAGVRLHFVLQQQGPDLPEAERMWVDVTEPLSDQGRYRGVLTNEPVYLKDISAGDTVEFGPEHIAQILVRRDDPNWVDCAEQAALVSAMVFDEGEMIRFAYREGADNEQDSGWRLFTGHEASDYTDDPDNIRPCEVGWLLDFDPTLDAIIRSENGAVFERPDRSAAWTLVTDWAPPAD